MSFKIKTLILQEGSDEFPFARRMVERLQGVSKIERERGLLAPRVDAFHLDKETLRLIAFPGELLKPCPGTQEYLCCGYQILNIGTNCPLDCSYCILQVYFNQPSLRVFVNVEHQLEALGVTLEGSGKKVWRIGTGEFTDSLALDPVAKWTKVLLPFVDRHENVVLEFKTKTVSIEGLLSSPHRHRIVVSWSLNSPAIAAKEEHGAPSIKRRLEAARACQREGYLLGFHFDPLIEHPSWKEEYTRAVDLLDHYIDPANVVWLSLGCLRYIPSLKPVIRRRFPESGILDGEFILGLDGKMRYIKPLRVEMYGFMKEKLDQWGMGSGVYLCMESSDVWQKSLGCSPGTSEGLARVLDERATELFGMGK